MISHIIENTSALSIPHVSKKSRHEKWNEAPSTELVGQSFPKIQDYKFSDIVASTHNDKLHLIPACARKVVVYDAKTDEWEEIGDDDLAPRVDCIQPNTHEAGEPMNKRFDDTPT